MQSAPTKQSDSEGIGFLVENLLNDLNNDNGTHDNGTHDNGTSCDNEEFYNKEDKKYDEIKQSILAIYKKIKQRKNYNHKMYNNK